LNTEILQYAKPQLFNANAASEAGIRPCVW